jgi:hypothetical protein
MRTADMPPPRVDPHHPANVTLLRTMRAGNPDAKPIRTPDEVPDPYFECGAHPDIVEHVWERIGTRLPKEARCLLFGTPALVQPTSGVVLVICMGTAYFLRVPSARRGDALAAGSLQSIGWNPHDVRDLEKDYGEDWFVGGSEGDEVTWCTEAFAAFSDVRSRDEDMLTPATPSNFEPSPAGALVLEVTESSGKVQRRAAVNPSASTIATTVRDLDWSSMTSATLLRDGDTWFEVSGCTDPDDGLSASYSEDGTEYVIREAPADVDALVRLLTSYAAGDDAWRTMVDWE